MKKISTPKLTIQLYLYHVLRYKRFAVPLLLSVPVVVLVMNFLQPYIQAQIIQKISTGNFDPSNTWGSFGLELSVYAAAVIVSSIAGWRLNIWLIWKLEMNVLRDMAQQVFEHLIDLDANFHANRFGGSLVSQTNKLIASYIRFADAIIFSLYTLLISMIATIVIIGPRVPIYAVILIVISTVYMIGTVWLSRPVRQANIKQAEQESRQTGQLADSISNIMAVKSFAAEKHEARLYWKEATKTKQAAHRSMTATTYRETYAATMTSVISIAALIIAIIGTRYFDADIATLFLIVSYTSLIGMRLWEFQSVLRQINRALGDASDMVKILQIKPAIQDPKNPLKANIVRGQIDIENITYSHSSKDNPLFKDLTLTIKSGQKVGLVGRSGSGKTSLTSLLLRFADPQNGMIKIDGQNVRHITQNELRKHITYVPQEPLLFHRTLAENISYARPSASTQEITAIAKMAHAHEFIKGLPDGYQTLVGERGVKLSGGQRQRIAIARAMLKNAPILVLDEATSALDSESEELIQDALWRLMEGRTAIVIAHRLSTIQQMDRIIVLDNGAIIEDGSHRELINQGGKYAELWSRQSGGFLEE